VGAILEKTLSLPFDTGLAQLLAKTTQASGRRQSLGGEIPDGLTEREVEILKLVAKGKSNREIADELYITVNTVANHIKNILSKTATSNRTEAAAYARERRLA
jgi:DNA-binding NarL/FixJ family response regulator